MTAGTSLAAETLAVGDVDGALVALGCARIERRGGALFIECADRAAERAIALLARAGARAIVTDVPSDHTRSLVPAVVADLDPRPAAVVDRISIRAIETGEAAAQLLRRRWRLVPPSVERIHAVRRLLRGEDRLFAWCRVIWARPRQLRSGELGGVTPVVFDRDAVTRGDERFAFTTQGLLTRWART